MKIFNMFLILFACFSGTQQANSKNDKSLSVNTPEITNSATTYSVSKKNYKNLTDAVVIVKTPTGYGSGTLFKIKNRTIVITASHVVSGLEYATVVFSGSEYLSSIVYDNPEADVAILLSPEIEDADPMSLKILSSVEVGDRLSYCGYPNRQDLGCFSGEVSHISEKYINVHTYAWMGASGSAVINKRGKLVGILSGVEVGSVWGRMQIVEDVVWVRPVTQEMVAAAIEEIEKI